MLGMGWFPDQPGGLNRYFRSLHRALEDAGETPSAVVLGPASDAPSSVRVVGRSTLPLLLRIPLFSFAAWQAALNTNLIDAHFALYAFGLTLLPGGLDRPLVVHFQGPWADESTLAGNGAVSVRAKRRIERRVYRQADLAVVLSPAFRQVLVEGYGVAPWRVQVVVPGVDLVRFAPGDREEARTRFGVPHNAWTVLAVRRLVPRMGIDILLDAWVQVVAASPECLLLIVGEGSDRSALQRRATTLGLGSNVRFLGFLAEADLPAAYRAADASVVPTTALEGFGLVTLESLASGTPVVVTDIDGLADVPAQLDPGSVVPAGDKAALAKRLADAANGTRPLTDSVACRSFAERFSWDAVRRRHVELYGKVLVRERRPISVVYLDHVAQLSGGELALARLLPALAEVDAHVILGADGPLVEHLQEAGISAEVMALAPKARELRRGQVTYRPPVSSVLYTAAYVVRLARRLRTLRPDLVHTNSLKAALYGGVAARLAGVPVVWHIRDRIAADYLPAPAVSLVRIMARWLPTSVITNSDATLATIEAHTRRARRIWSGVPLHSTVDQVRHRPAEGPLVVGMVGRLAPWKGQHVFLRAFALACHSKGDRAVLVGGALFGEDAYEQSLLDLIDELGIGGRVELLGHRNDVVELLGGFDILVHASVTPEPFGQVVVEGMAAGLPVIATEGGPSEVMTDGVDGLLVPRNDIEAMARALRRLAGDPGLRAELGRRARKTAEKFTPEAAANELMAVYRQCRAGNG